MKVLRIINSLNIGGAERSIETNVPIHIKNGIDMDVLLLNGKKTPFLENLLKKGVKVYVTAHNMSIYNPLQVFKIIPYLRKYDIVHVHLFPCQYWVAIAKIISLSKVKLVVTEHSTSNKRRKKWYFRYIDKFFYKPYKKIISISDATTYNLKKHIGNNFDIVTINNGVDLYPIHYPNRNLTHSDVFVKDNSFIISQIASLRYPKDQDTVIRALASLPKNFELLLIGDGVRKEELKRIVDELQVNERVHFLGNRTDIPDIIYMSDIIVMSSHYEGFGRAAIEGMAGGRPLIASDVAGLNDIVRGAGLLFKVGDYETLAEYILELSNNKELYKKIAHKCSERAEEYDVKKMIEGYEYVYNSL